MSPQTIAAEREEMRRIVLEMARHRSGQTPAPDFEIIQGDGFLVAKLETVEEAKVTVNDKHEGEYCEL